MAKTQRLFKRANGNWNFRVSVPEKLRKKIGKTEIWHSFGSVSHAEARVLARLESIKADARFAAAAEQESSAQPLSTLNEGEILLIAQKYLQGLEANADPMPFGADAREARRLQTEDDAFDVSRGDVYDPVLQRVASSLAGEAGRDVLSGLDLLRVTEGVQRALLEHYAREVDRARPIDNLEVKPTHYDVAFSGISASPLPAPPLTVKKAIELYKAAPERSNVAPKTRTAYNFRYAVLEELLGPGKEISTVTRADARDVQKVLLKLPPNASKRFPKRTLREIADLATRDDINPMSSKSTVLYVEALSALFNWLTREEMASRNPAIGMKLRALRPKAKRRPFSFDELNVLFGAPAFSGEKGGGWLFWLPRLALYSGARFAELLALRVSDIVVEDGVSCMSIVPNDLRELKNKGSERYIPIHPTLIDAGFLQHVARQPKDGLIFPDALGPKDMITARNKIMGRAVRAVFEDKSLVFHSFRHAFKDAAARARIPRELVSLIGGWRISDGHAAMDDYGRDKLLPVLFEEISKITFPGFNTSPT